MSYNVPYLAHIQSLKSRWEALVKVVNRESELDSYMASKQKEVFWATSLDEYGDWASRRKAYLARTEKLRVMAEKVREQHNRDVSDYNIYAFGPFQLAPI